jgi:hypothetical protein
MLGFIFTVLLAQSSITDPPLDQAGDWRVNEGDSGSCTAAMTYADGTVFVLSYDSHSAEGLIFLGNPRWRSVVAGQEYPFVIEMPIFGSLSLRGHGVPVDELGGFTIPFSGVTLITRLMESDSMAIQTGRNWVGRYSLAGSYDAALELARCNRRAMDRIRPDPFAN